MLPSAPLTDALSGVSELAERIARHVVRELGEAALATHLCSGALFGSSRRLHLPGGNQSMTVGRQGVLVGFRI